MSEARANIAEEIKTILETIGLPVSQTTYTGNADTYIVFNFSTIPSMFADDAPQYDRYLIQIHIFAPVTQSITAIERKIKEAVFAAGYTWPSRIDASDTTRSAAGAERHIVLETETVEAM